jgi:hypothetical protein
VKVKAEWSNMYVKLAQQRYYVKGVHESHKQRLVTSVEAAKVAEDRAKKLEETIGSISQQLEISPKSLKAREETLKSTPRAVRRRIN